MGKSAIEWTGETLNTWTGCSQVSAGCANCYIPRQTPLRIAGRSFRKGVGKTLSEDQPDDASPLLFYMHRLEPMVRRRKPTLYFVNSMSDTFHEDVPDELIADLFAAMAVSRQHTFQVLTKRPKRMQALLSSPGWKRMLANAIERLPGDYWAAMVLGVGPPVLPNVWLGVTVENRSFTWRADLLRATPAAVRFLSCEPLLGPLVTTDFVADPGFTPKPGGIIRSARLAAWPDGKTIREHPQLDLSGIDWVIAGGESGPGARPCREEWLCELKQACFAAGDVCPACKGHGGSLEPTPGYGYDYIWCDECNSTGRVNRPRFFLKQLGGNPDKRGGNKAILQGRLWHEMPPTTLDVPLESAQGRSAQGSLL